LVDIALLAAAFGNKDPRDEALQQKQLQNKLPVDAIVWKREVC
jgi:hypothetical protein